MPLRKRKNSFSSSGSNYQREYTVANNKIVILNEDDKEIQG